MPVTDSTASAEPVAERVAEPVVVVSADCHIGPRLVEDLRPYCPADLLAAYDAYVDDPNRSRGRYLEREEAVDPDSPWRNRLTDGHHDPAARRRDLDHEGVAAEVVFHGSQNDQPVPFQTSMLGANDDPELAAAGIRIYNRWLADACAAAPDRHVGLAHLPMWDVDAAVAELRWAAGAGLRGVNFPAPRPWLRHYNDRAWEPFWAAAEELSMPLTTHSGAGDPTLYAGPELGALQQIESGGWFSRRAAHHMIFSGVFERHPGLVLVLTEQPGEWWPYLATELDTVHMSATRGNARLAAQVPELPSHYLHRNVYIGGSFLSRTEAVGAIRDGYADRIMWGSDYPHMEGTYQYQRPETPDAERVAMGKLSIRWTFAGLDRDAVRAMLGGTAAKVYGLDPAALAATARTIGAMTWGEIDAPLEAVPAGASPFAFRTVGPWA
ncbi:amidohydrolase family protein [Streptomycetaceae bacterium NBC_01309]